MNSHGINSFSSMRGRSFNLQSIFKMNNINAGVQNHLFRVYLTLATMLVAACIGVKVHILTGFGGMLSSIVLFGIMLFLAFDSDKRDTPKRSALTLAFGFFKGVSLGHFVETLLYVDPFILYIAFG